MLLLLKLISFARLCSRSARGVVLAIVLAGAIGASPARAASFTQDIRPLLETHCFKCHNAEKHKGGVDFSSVAEASSVARQRKLWRAALTQVTACEMPPAEEKQLTPDQRELLLGWLGSAAKVDCSDPANRDPGPALVRRLNRAEYNLTIRDLVGIEFEAGEAVGMPDDGVVTGFDNLAASLNLPPTLLEKYFAAAAPAYERLAMINLISDLTERDFGGYHAVLAVHAEGSIEAEKMQIFRAYDSARPLGLARRLAGLE